LLSLPPLVAGRNDFAAADANRRRRFVNDVGFNAMDE
jgi:hypothetical protein